jgi:hypothetical protein
MRLRPNLRLRLGLRRTARSGEAGEVAETDGDRLRRLLPSRRALLLAAAGQPGGATEIGQRGPTGSDDGGGSRGGGSEAGTPGGESGGEASGGQRRPRRLSRRWRVAALVALLAVLPGGITAGSTLATNPPGLVPAGAELDGFLPVQDEAPLDGFLDPEQLAAVPVGPGQVAEPVRAVLSSSRIVGTLGESGIPEVAMRAYVRGADQLAADDPSCGVRWTLLAAIGRVESNHGRFGGAELREDGYGTRPIRGIPLDGRPSVALIRDSDGGALDGDTTYDRAVGPMQFIPSTWRSVMVDGNGDSRRDPNNIFDAARGAAVYLCAGGGDLRNRAGLAQAVRRYNNADEYVMVVLNLARAYETGRYETLPSLPAPPPRQTPPASIPRPSPPRPAPAPPSPQRPAPAPPAAVGWAPAMREVVGEVMEEEPPPAAPPTTAPAPPTTAPEPPPECPPDAVTPATDPEGQGDPAPTTPPPAGEEPAPGTDTDTAPGGDPETPRPGDQCPSPPTEPPDADPAVDPPSPPDG